MSVHGGPLRIQYHEETERDRDRDGDGGGLGGSRDRRAAAVRTQLVPGEKPMDADEERLMMAALAKMQRGSHLSGRDATLSTSGDGAATSGTSRTALMASASAFKELAKRVSASSPRSSTNTPTRTNASPAAANSSRALESKIAHLEVSVFLHPDVWATISRLIPPCNRRSHGRMLTTPCAFSLARSVNSTPRSCTTL